MWENLYDSLVRMGVPAFGENDVERGVYMGLAMAAIVIVCFLVLRFLLKRIFRRKSLRGITLKRENGYFFVARQAIQAVLLALSEEMPALEIGKVELFRRRGGAVLSVSAEFDASAGAFAVIAETFQKRALEELQTTFGADTVKAVDVHLAKVTGKAPRRTPTEQAELPHEPPAGI